MKIKDQIIIIGDRWIEENLFQQYQEGEEMIKNFINVRYTISGFVRDEIWDYPLTSIREALVNALIHRDYFQKGQQVMVKVFDEHLWMYNPGNLPPGLTIDDLKRSPRSLLRNPLLGKVFYLAGHGKQYGSGIRRIIQACAQARLPEPEIAILGAGFGVIMEKDHLIPKYLASLGLSERQIDDMILTRYACSSDARTPPVNVRFQSMNII